MSQIIDLATFKFDESSLITSIAKTKQALLELKAQQTINNNDYKTYQKTIDAQVLKQNELTLSGKQNTQEYKDNAIAINANKTAQQQILQSNVVLANNINSVNNEFKQQNIALAGSATTASGTTTAYKNLNDEMNKLKLDAKNLGAELLILEREGKKGTAEYKALEIQFKDTATKANDLNDAFKTVDKAVGDNNRNVGDYKEQIKSAFQEVNIFNGGIGGFIQRSQEAGGAGTLLKTSFLGISTGIAGATKASLGFLATPLGIVIGALGLVLAPLVSYLTQTQDGINKLSAATAPLIGVFNSLIGLFQNLGKNLFEAFSNPKKTLIDLGNFVKENLINRFTAFSVILEGIVNLDFKKVANGVIQAGTGVANATDKITKASEKTSKFLSDAAKRGSDIARLGKEITANELSYQSAARKTGDEIDKNLLISKDTSRSFAERETASRNIIKLTKELGTAEEAIIDKKIRQLQLQMQQGSVTNDQRKELENLKNQKEDAGDRGVQAEIEQLRVIAGAKKEQQAKAEEASKKASEDAKVKREKDAEARKKELEDQKTNALALANTEIETAKIALQAYLDANQSKLTDAKRLTNDLIAEEKKRLDNVLEKNRDLLTGETRVKNEQLSGEIKLLQDKKVLSESEKLQLADLNLQKANLQTEYLLKDKQLVDANGKAKKDIDTKYDAQLSEERKIKQAQEFQLKLAQLEANGATEYELQVAKLDNETALAIQKYNDKTDLEFQTGIAKRLEQDALLTEEQAIKDQLTADLQATKDENEKIRIQNLLDGITIIEKNKAEKTKQIDDAVMVTKLQAYSKVFGDIGNLFGKETAAAKIAGVAQAGINTYLGATQALANPTLPFPTNVISAGTIIASGLQSVGKIAGFATGGIITDGQPISRRNGDDVLITAKRGEVILNKTQQQMLGGAQTFARAGVPGFATGGVVGSNLSSVQKSITSSLDMSILAETIGQAVFEGANTGTASGSESGIVGLSTNRQIANNANF